MTNKRITLTTGETFPAEINLGAMLLFKKETGREVTEADYSAPSDLITLLWCAASAASEVAEVKMDYTLQQFANRVTADTLKKWSAQMQEGQKEVPDDAKKKAAPES